MAKGSDGSSELRDGRLPPFCYQTHAAINAIRALYADGGGYGKLGMALAVYMTFTEVAYGYGGPEAREGGFTATRREIAAAVGIGRDSLDQYVAALERAGVLGVEHRQAGVISLSNVWTLIEPDPALVHSPPSRAHSAGVPTPPDRGAEPGRHVARDPYSAKEVTRKNHPPVVPPAKPHGKVDGKPVTEAEHELGSSVLAAFNELAGTRYSAGSWLGKVVLRCREVPDLDVAGHRHVIEAALADPWWKGGPSPSVIYGNAALFERCLHLAAAPGDERPLTPDEIGTYGILWGPGTGYDSLAAARRAEGDSIELDDADVVDLDP